MRKKIVSMFLATALVIAVGMETFPKVATADEEAMVKIAVDEQLDDINILTITEYSDTLDWIYKMTYDTLITLDEDGNFAPGLAEEWQVVVLDEGGGENSFDPNLLEFEDWPVEWTTSYPPGWEMLQGYDYSEDVRGGLEFCIGDSRAGIYIKLRRDLPSFFGEVTSGTIYDMLVAAYSAPSETLFHKQWAPFAYSNSEEDVGEDDFVPQGIEILGEYEFMLYPKFESYGKGWIDILYSLTEPISGIFNPNTASTEDDYVYGSGAYIFEEFNATEGYVQLTPNAGWRLGAVPTQDVKFVFIPDEVARWTTFGNNEVDVVVTPPNAYNEDLEGVTWATEGNPLYLIMNKENWVLSSEENRKAIAKIIPNDSEESEGGMLTGDIQNEYVNNTISPLFNHTLSYMANGIWTKDARLRDLLEIESEQLNRQIRGQSFTILYYGDELYDRVVEELQWQFENEGITLVEDKATSKADFERKKNAGAYDFMLKEIEVSNLNSAYHELYGKISDDTDYMLRGAMYAANLETYAYLHAQVQIKLHNDASYINLGWQKKIISNKSGVSGITFPTGGFSPTGDVSRIDFRGVTKI